MTTLDMSQQMRKNLDYVIKGIQDSNDKSTVANITMLFKSKRWTKLKVYLSREIKWFHVHQDFVRNYTDKMTAELEIGIDEYKVLYSIRKDLWCDVEITYLRPDHTVDLDEVPCGQRKADFTLKCKAMLIQYEDIFKKIPAERLWPKDRDQVDQDRPTLKMTVELIEEKMYYARKEVINAVFRDTYMHQVLKYVCNYLGFDKAHIEKPHNTKQYTNFVIPPSKGIDTIIPWLQTAPGFGIYTTGCCFYVARNIVYIWPRYGEPCCKYPRHVYCIANNVSLESLNRTDCRDKDCAKTYHMLVAGGLNEKNHSDVGTENAPDAFNVFMDQNAIDGTRRLKADGVWEANQMVRDLVVLPSDPIDMHDFIKVQFRHSHDNEFALYSELQSYQGSTVEFDWAKARPWSFIPSTVVNIHYDDPTGYKTIKGMTESADYMYRKAKNANLEPLFICSAKIRVEVKNILGGERNNFK